MYSARHSRLVTLLYIQRGLNAAEIGTLLAAIRITNMISNQVPANCMDLGVWMLCLHLPDFSALLPRQRREKVRNWAAARETLCRWSRRLGCCALSSSEAAR